MHKTTGLMFTGSLSAATVAVLMVVAAGPLQTMAAQEPRLNLKEATIKVDGATLSYRMGGSGPPVMMLHGFTFTNHEWNPFLDALGAHFTLILPDLPGHGRSESLDEIFSARHTARAMFAIVDALGIDRFRVVGHSSGANVLLHMATQQSQRVEAMVLVNGGHRLIGAARQSLATLTLEGVEPPQREYYRQYHPGGEPQLRSLFRQVRALADNYDDHDLSPEHLATVSARTLLVWGDRDETNPIDIAVELYKAIPHASLWVVPDQGHMPVWEQWGGSAHAQARFPNAVREFFQTKSVTGR